MFSDKCPFCSDKLEFDYSFKLGFTFFCCENYFELKCNSHYYVKFANDVIETESFEYNNFLIINNFVNKTCTIYTSVKDLASTRSSIQIDCYISPYNLEKLENYLILI